MAVQTDQNFVTLTRFIEKTIVLKKPAAEVFGVPLEKFMTVQKSFFQILNVPWVVRLCTDGMICKGFALEGIFRVPGCHTDVANICAAFNKGEIPNFKSVGQEEISGVFKKYIRELPDPILVGEGGGQDLENKFAAVLDIRPLEDQIPALKDLVSLLTEYNRALAKEIFLLLYLVSLQADENKMDALNLATIFGGMINLLSQTLGAETKKQICYLLIENYPAIFQDVNVLEKPAQELSEEDKAAKIVLPVFLDDSSLRTFFIKKGDTARAVCAVVTNKIQMCTSLEVTDQWKLWEVRDREIRLIEDDELVALLVNRPNSGRVVFSGAFDRESLSTPWYVSLNRRGELDVEDVEVAEEVGDKFVDRTLERISESEGEEKKEAEGEVSIGVVSPLPSARELKDRVKRSISGGNLKNKSAITNNPNNNNNSNNNNTQTASNNINSRDSSNCNTPEDTTEASEDAGSTSFGEVPPRLRKKSTSSSSLNVSKSTGALLIFHPGKKKDREPDMLNSEKKKKSSSRSKSPGRDKILKLGAELDTNSPARKKGNAGDRSPVGTPRSDDKSITRSEDLSPRPDTSKPKTPRASFADSQTGDTISEEATTSQDHHPRGRSGSGTGSMLQNDEPGVSVTTSSSALSSRPSAHLISAQPPPEKKKEPSTKGLKKKSIISGK